MTYTMRKAVVSVLMWLLVACAPVPSASSTTPPAATSGRTDSPSSTPLSTARPSPQPVALDSLSLKGTGSKNGEAAVLQGDYVLRDTVTTKAGCHFRVYLDGFDTEPLDDVSTDAGGSTSNEVDEQGLDLSTYRLRVVASKCGAWAVSLRRN